MFMALNVMMVQLVFTYLQAHQVVHIKYVRFLYINHTPTKWLKKDF